MGIPRTILLLAAAVAIAIGRRHKEAAENKFNGMMRSGVKLCAADPPSVTEKKVSLIHCATRCASLTSCAHFNYRNNGRICQLYLFKPECYSSTPTCAHYQSESYLPETLLKGIPAQNCSFPFTNKGSLYYSCIQNVSNTCDCRCLVGKRVWQTVSDSIDYVAVNQTINVTIPTFISPTPLISVNDWIIIQQRIDGSENFDRSWVDYRAGFGNISSNFWLGLEKMHQLTSSRTKKLRIEIQSSDNSKWFSAEYDTFLIDSEVEGYAIHVTGYSGDAGDGLNVQIPGRRQNGMKFSTSDRDNDKDSTTESCAIYLGGGGFWLNNCCYFSLNHPYGLEHFYWHLLTDLNLAKTELLKASRMMIKDI